MKSQELQGLRVGNWVVTNFGTYKVASINANKCTLKTPYEEISYSLINCDPVPTTTELLTECGFKMIRGKKVSFVKTVKGVCENDIFLSVNSDYSMSINNSLEKLDVSKFHKLQNTYLTLTGGELLPRRN